MTVKAGICVAYDWVFLKQSLPAIYPYMNSICLSIDRERRSWNGNLFDMDWEGFIQMIKEIDTDEKVFILEETFYSNERTPIANECYQRNRMAEFLGKADWYVQIDTDEIIINAAQFVKELSNQLNRNRPINIHGVWINLIKQTERGFIYSVLKTPPLATNNPVYEYGRTNGHFNIYVNIFLAHITWARPQKEVQYKLKNWGHSHEFNGMSFYKIWEALDDHNWVYIRDFHPMNKGSIDRLHFHAAKDVEEFVKTFDPAPHSITERDLLQNNIWISRINKLLQKVK